MSATAGDVRLHTPGDLTIAGKLGAARSAVPRERAGGPGMVVGARRNGAHRRFAPMTKTSPTFLSRSLFGAPPAADAPRLWLCADPAGNKVALVSADGKGECDSACKHPQDVRVLPHGNSRTARAAGTVGLTRAKPSACESKAGEKTEVQATQPWPSGHLPVACGDGHKVREFEATRAVEGGVE